MDTKEQRLLQAAQHKPRFLFRAASERSRGRNSAYLFDPLATYGVDYHQDLAEIPWGEAAYMVMMHLLFQYQVPSEFCSWSVSLLWVLVHAISKTRAHKGRKAECPTKILIYVLDTENIPDTRVHRSKDLISIFDLGQIEHIEEYSRGEYLIHGRLQKIDGFKAVTLGKLIHGGLYVRYPGLKPDDEDYKVHIRSRKLLVEYSNQIWTLGQLVTPNYRFLGRIWRKVGGCNDAGVR
ncbi:hypothetical protein LTR17_001424 [Elasticomyces elasticus]|nr:hypothetical protein LTR17_001424 [Elasticomyces elasticus]